MCQVTYSNRTGEHSLIVRLYNPEYRHHYVYGAVPLVPERSELFHSCVDVSFQARLDQGLDENGMWLIADFEDVVC